MSDCWSESRINPAAYRTACRLNVTSDAVAAEIIRQTGATAVPALLCGCEHCTSIEQHTRREMLQPAFFVFLDNSPQWVRASSFTRSIYHTQRRSTVDRTPLEERSVRRRDLYLTTHNTHKRQTSMALVGFEPTISAGEWPQTYALDRAATGTGSSGAYDRI